MDYRVKLLKYFSKKDISNNIHYVIRHLPEEYIEKEILTNIKLDVLIIVNLSLNKNITLRFIKKHDYIKFSYYHLSDNPNITIDFIRRNLGENWNWRNLSKNIPINDIKKHMNFPWIFEYVSDNNTVTMDFVIDNLELNWNWTSLSMNIHIDEIKEYPNLNWRPIGLSNNKTITIDFVLANPDIEWDYNLLSKCLPLGDIIKYPKLKWNYFFMSQNKTVNINYVIKHINKDWDYSELSRIIPLKDIIRYLKKNVSTKKSIFNRVVGPRIYFLVTRKIPWNLNKIIHNETITIEFLLKYYTSFCSYKYIMENKLTTINNYYSDIFNIIESKFTDKILYIIFDFL